MEYETNFLFESRDSMDDSNFTIEELNKVVDAQKNRTSPGPNSCTSELIKWLDQENRYVLLDIYKNILDHDVYPEILKVANIVSIYKKGDATKMQDYRPIALLQTLYKIFAGLIKNRLLYTYDPCTSKSVRFQTQKIHQAIFIARRLMDISERTCWTGGRHLTR